MKQSAGIVFYKFNPFRVLLVHPAGNFNRKAKWSIPKGEHDLEKDSTSIWNTASREVKEELGIIVNPNCKFIDLGSVVYQSRSKRVSALALNYNLVEEQKIVLNWENDEAKFFTLEEMKNKIHPDQFDLILRLTKILDLS